MPDPENSWVLVAPDWAGKDTIWRSPLPVALWPVCDKALLSYWLDEAVRLGVGAVRIEALDRPHLIRQWLDKRDLWSRSITVSSRQEAPGGGERIILNRLPGQPAAPDPADGVSLLRWWLQMQSAALHQRNQTVVHLDQEIAPGIWIGPGAKVSPAARLQAPCWVGSYARISPGCQLGPGAFVGSGCFLDEGVEMTDSLVCRDSYVGAHTSLQNKIVQGGLLLDLDRGLAVEVSDPLLLNSLETSACQPAWWERGLALVAGPWLRLLARWTNAREQPAIEEYVLGHHRKISLATYPKGPLLLRRSPWLRAVAGGHLRLCGILPRTAEQWEDLAPEVRANLAQAPVGIIAFSDLHQCHSAEEPEEWMHALYQTSSASAGTTKQLHRAWLKLAFTTPQIL
jgi:hypothetical protein